MCRYRCEFSGDTEEEEAEMSVDRQAEVMDHEMTDQESTSRQLLPDHCGQSLNLVTKFTLSIFHVVRII